MEQLDRRCACVATTDYIENLEGFRVKIYTRNIELLSHHQYGSVGLCGVHLNQLASLFGLTNPIRSEEQARRLSILWRERGRGNAHMRTLPEMRDWFDEWFQNSWIDK